MPNLRAWCAAAWEKRTLARVLWAPLLALVGFAPNSTESASANGETRTLNLYEPHTNESGTFTYMVNGTYDRTVLDKLNWFMRDWRHDEQTQMDPKMFDVVWEVYRESGSNMPVEVLSGYRSPETNAMLRRRSRQVAEHSLHMQGKAMDAHFQDVPTSKIRDIAMRMQDGGVGFYPTGMTPWVHIDSGSVRYWPRMSRDALARLFPDGKTVHIPADGVPMPGYEQARAEIEARGGSVFAANASAGQSKSLLAMLFGGGEDEGDEEAIVAQDAPRGRGGASSAPSFASAAHLEPTQRPTVVASAQPDAITQAKRDLPQGETFIGPAPASANAAKSSIVASLDTNVDTGAQAVPTPPHRPNEFSASASAGAPTPPVRPVELAALQTQSLDSPDSQRKNDAITALLTRKLPSVITRGLNGPLPRSALALADPDTPVPPERAALLAKAAAIPATFAAPLAKEQRLSPLERAALLYAPLPPINRGPLKPTLVAAKIDRSNFGVMTAPKTPSAALGALKLTTALPPRADAMIVAFTPTAEGDGMFKASLTSDLRTDAFSGASTLGAPRGLPAPSDMETLRGTD